MVFKTSGTEILKKENSNITFQICVDNVVAVLRVHFRDESRRNAKSPDYQAQALYFESMRPPKGYYSRTFEISSMTNFCLFCERRKQWLLEHVLQEFEHNGISK